MNKFSTSNGAPVFSPTVLAASLLLAFGSAGAQQVQPTPDELRQELFTPTSEVSVGLGHQSNDARRFGTYRGNGENGAYGLIDLNLVKRDDDTGTWMKFRGKDLGLDSREFRLDHERQGNWSYFFQASEMARKEPLIVNTGVQGLGTASQTVSALAVKRNVDLQMEHNIYALGVRKYMAGGFDIRLSAKQDDASGDRIFGERIIGNNTNFLTEPIDRTTRQWEVVAGYADRKLQLSGGYSGSSYDTKNPVLTIRNLPTTLTNTSYLALPPNNHSHQLHLAGGYNLSDTTRTSFKVSRTQAYQNEQFDSAIAPNASAPNSVNGKVSTSLVYTDVTMRPMDRLNLTGSLRVEDRDDETPELRYLFLTPATDHNASPGGAGISGFNKPRSLKQIKGGLEASYQLNDGYRVIGSLEREDMKRNGPTAPIGVTTVIPIRAGYRAKTDETTQRIEFKRTMSDVLNGGIALIHSKRGGSDYVNTTYTNNQNNVAGLIWADRSRNKVRLSADWIPAEQWSLQFLADFSEDTYSGRKYGPSKGTAQFLSGDLVYKINDNWNMTTWLSREKLEARQTSRASFNAVAAIVGPPAVATIPAYTVDWSADIRDTSTAIGIGVKGALRGNLRVGADLSGSYDVAEHGQTLVSTTGSNPNMTSPGFFYRQASLKLFADYALERNSGIRVNLNVDRRRNNDWTWQNWTYSDGTSVKNVPYEKTTFVGISYYYRWR